ncbi:hypothetical protein BDAP_001590 [Binucleata daphniae]
MKIVGLEINKEKSATNSTLCSHDTTYLDSKKSYKYLGITETNKTTVLDESYHKIKKEILESVERLCKTNLNAINLFKAINEHVVSVIDYHIGVLKLEPKDFNMLDDDIRKTFVKFKIYMQPANKEGLYLPRDKLGRMLINIEHRSEQMLLMLNNTLTTSKFSSIGRAAILKVENDNQTHLSLIPSYLKVKYNTMTQLN